MAHTKKFHEGRNIFQAIANDEKKEEDPPQQVIRGLYWYEINSNFGYLDVIKNFILYCIASMHEKNWYSIDVEYFTTIICHYDIINLFIVLS